ncbi:MAG TPA: MCE family protein [Streptosporangiaceae bacterium]|jgi:phospholipid/cholesterol/gamma-HCH transport system substrate-binding protein
MRKRAVLRATATAAAAVTALAVAGCGSGGFNGIYSLPLPGGASLGSHPYTITAEFANVNDLVPQSAVRVNNVAVGRVSSIYLPPGSWTAHVTMVVNGDVHLPANADAELQQSSLLGEWYVQLSPPPGGLAEGRLANHALIPLSRTTGNATVEEVLGALSLLLNGGGVAQLHTITTQLNDAFTGNEPQLRSLLSQISKLAANLNSRRGDITNAITGLNQLSKQLRSRNKQIGSVLDNLAPGLRVISNQRSQLVTLLNSLHKLTGVAVSTINKSQDNMVGELQALTPILRNLADAGQALPESLQVLLTYPFTDQVLKDIKGDYLNIYLKVTAAPGTTIIPPVTPKKQGGGSGQTAETLPLPAINASTGPAAAAPGGHGQGGGS